MLRNITKLLTGVIVLAITVACGNSKKQSEERSEKLPKIDASVLVNRLDSLSDQRPGYFYTKLKSSYKDSEYDVSFKTSIRMRNDSALHALITYARIPIYNTMVTPDTLTIVDKRNNCYVKEDMTYLKNTFDVDFEHDNLEELILGMPIGWDKELEYHQVKDPYNYVVSSHSKRELRRMDKNDDDELIVRYYLTDDAQLLRRVLIDSPKDTTTIDVNYSDHELINGMNIPGEGAIEVVTPRDTIEIDFKYNRTTVNEPCVLYLAIPERYEKCE
ncbi:MAG: DUF4292 domain-containing protein [Bacteroidota bacterium]